MPPLLTGGRHCLVEQSEPKKTEPKTPTSLLLETPVRSGQSVIFTEGDVTILGSVGSGAEIVAGGSIHVYGALRGRAMAGVNGNSNARIYCQKIEAELLAIDGYYQTAEEIDGSLRGRPAQAWLQGDLALWKDKAALKEEKDRRLAATQMARWQADADLAETRPGAKLADWTEQEAKAWDQLWAEVRETLAQAQQP